MEVTSGPSTPLPSPPDPTVPGSKRMPDLAGGTHAHTHTVHSALVSLDALGVSRQRVVLRRAGRNAVPSGTIVRQSPPPGAALQPSTLIHLEIAGLGFTHSLPVGMWDSGGEVAAGTREILEPFDDPLEKLKHWFHEGAPLFRLTPEDSGAAARWLALFGVDAEAWPRQLWYRLASLIAQLSQLSSSESGCALVLDVLLGLPVAKWSYLPSLAVLPAEALSHLGERSSRLGVDLLVGDALEDLAVTEVELGPVSLAMYQHYAETPGGAALLRRVLELIMPASTGYEVRWSVEDRRQAPRLGVPSANSRLGINTHMGTSFATSPANQITRFGVGVDVSLQTGSTMGSQP